MTQQTKQSLYLIGFLLLFASVHIGSMVYWAKEQDRHIVAGPKIVLSEKSLEVSEITLRDSNGNASLVIKAGPPATLEIRDDKGKIQSIDLPKLASRVRFFGEPKDTE